MHKHPVEPKSSSRYLLDNYNWYSAPHKYVRLRLYKFLEELGQTNFSDSQAVLLIKQSFTGIKGLLESHANHENEVYHPLLSENQALLNQVEKEHHDLDTEFSNLEKIFAHIESIYITKEQRVLKGQEFYLCFSNYISNYMKHLVNEETILMPEMRKLHTVKILREKVTFNTYQHMSEDDMVEMLSHLSPPLNFQEKAVLLLDIHDSDLYHQNCNSSYKAKFPHVWNTVKNNPAIISEKEKEQLTHEFENSNKVFKPALM